MVMRPSLLVQERAGEPPKAMPCHNAAVTEAAQSKKCGVVAHRLPMIVVAGKEQLPACGAMAASPTAPFGQNT
jgi:hypothetical protein